MSWEKVRLWDIVDKIQNVNPIEKMRNKHFEYIDISSIDATQKKILASKKILGSEAPSRARQIISDGDVIVSTVRPNLNAVSYFNNNTQDVTVASTGFCILRPQKDKIDNKYLFYWTQSKEFIRRMVERATGASYPAVSDSIIKDELIPLPSIATQKKIAAILDKADALRKKDQQQLAKYDELLQSVFYDMFGDPVKNEKGWETKKLSDMIEFMTSGSRGWARFYQTTGDIFLRINNVKKNFLKLDDVIYVNAPKGAEAERTKVKVNDILLSITADLGRTAVIPDGFPTAYINQHLALIRLHGNYNSFYVSQYISSKGGHVQLMKSNKGGVKAGLNFNDIKELKIPLPPIALQNSFFSVAQNIQTQKEILKQQAEQSENLFQSLLQRAFKGELVQ